MLSIFGLVLLAASYAQSDTSCTGIGPVTSSWVGGFNIQSLYIPISTSVNGWSIDVTFSAPISGLTAWNAVSTTSDNIHFHLVNVNYNGAQSAGTVYSGVGFTATYPSSNPVPTITSILFNGANVCSGASPAATTTTKAPTTVASTTTASPGQTTTKAAGPINPSSLTTKYNYKEVITKSLLFYYAQRSGRLPANDNPIPYRFDSALGDVGQNGEDLTGGYYDAGDFVKFNFPMASMTTIAAWSIIDYQSGYTSAGQLATAQKMVKWASDYFIKSHVAPNKLYGQVGDGNIDHSYWGRPEQMTMARPAYFISSSNPGSDLAGETAAALAATSMVFATADPTYSALCLSHAKTLYTFAKTSLGIYSSSIPQAAAFYSSSSYADELTWAAVWLYRATKDVTYLNDAKTLYSNNPSVSYPADFSWDNKAVGVQVLLAKLTQSPTYINAVKTYCDAKVAQPKTPKGLLFISQWGSLRYAANAAFICLQAADLNINALAYRQFAQKQIHYALGDTGRSFVCGFGTNPPLRAHHASSSCPNKPASCDWNSYNSPGPNGQVLYGALVGGPDANDNYTDDRNNYITNEVATDYNAGFQASVAALQTLAVNGVFA